MSCLLPPDDLAVGDAVTIHTREAAGDLPMIIALGAAPAQARMESPAPGIPLRVTGISLPFVSCEVLDPVRTDTPTAILDLRTVVLARVEPGYLEAIMDARRRLSSSPRRQRRTRVPADGTDRAPNES